MPETLTEDRSNLPVWGQLALKIMKDHGVTAILALVFAWFLIANVTTGMEQVRAEHATMSQGFRDMTTSVADVGKDLRQHIQHDDDMLRLMKSVCMSTATSAGDHVAARECIK